MTDAPEAMILKLEHGIVKHGLSQYYAAPLALTAMDTSDPDTQQAGLFITHARPSLSIRAESADMHIHACKLV